MSADERARDELSASSRCLRSAFELFDDEGNPPLADPGALEAILDAAQQHLEHWLAWALEGNAESDLGYDAYDGIAAVRALLAAGLDLRNTRTIDPRRGVLHMASDRVEHLCAELDSAYFAEPTHTEALVVNGGGTFQ